MYKSILHNLCTFPYVIIGMTVCTKVLVSHPPPPKQSQNGGESNGCPQAAEIRLLPVISHFSSQISHNTLSVTQVTLREHSQDNSIWSTNNELALVADAGLRFSFCSRPCFGKLPMPNAYHILNAILALINRPSAFPHILLEQQCQCQCIWNFLN